MQGDINSIGTHLRGCKTRLGISINTFDFQHKIKDIVSAINWGVKSHDEMVGHYVNTFWSFTRLWNGRAIRSGTAISMTITLDTMVNTVIFRPSASDEVAQNPRKEHTVEKG
jgi:hypothetical protein